MQPLSFLLACNLVAIFQGGSWGGGGGTIEGRHVSYSYTCYSCAPRTWNSRHDPPSREKHQTQRSVGSISAGWDNSLGKTDHQVARVNEEAAVFLLARTQRRQAVNRAFYPWHLLCVVVTLEKSAVHLFFFFFFSSAIPYMSACEPMMARRSTERKTEIKEQNSPLCGKNGDIIGRVPNSSSSPYDFPLRCRSCRCRTQTWTAWFAKLLRLSF